MLLDLRNLYSAASALIVPLTRAAVGVVVMALLSNIYDARGRKGICLKSVATFPP